MNELDVNVDCCRARQRRLLAEMRQKDLDLVVVQKTEHVQWLAGPRFAWLVEAAAALTSDGGCTLVAPQAEPVVAADEIVTYEAHWYSTLRNDQRQGCSEALVKARSGKAKPRRIGVEGSTFGPNLAAQLKDEKTELLDIEPDLYRLRRFKHPDELARIKKAIAGTGRMYAKAREIIEPGINELTVFNALQAAAVHEFGEMLTGTGNDYACGERGGPPRDRRAQDGELYILDLGPAFRGYFADNCRAIAVNGRPTDVQHRAWQQLAGVFPIVERMVKPGASCRELFRAVQAHLDEYLPGNFDHHLGHGIGLFPHEAPHLNPRWDDTFHEGEVFTVEPGLYTAEMRAGIRLENDYLVTAGGVELLSVFPLEL
ncbi:MAG TPA: Xaa-Pro peptidase family protein [Pirellulales bacterium]|jgi:Xaa-Pro aminopeptidase|nr:Xaa-Pro peptidase family protein [Pirellulales bacterium]